MALTDTFSCYTLFVQGTLRHEPQKHYSRNIERIAEQVRPSPESRVQSPESRVQSPESSYYEGIFDFVNPPALYFILFLVVFSAIPARAQTPQHPEGSPAFFAAPLVEAAGFGRRTPAIGGGFALGAGSGTAIGLRLFYAAAPGRESVTMMELAVFMRLYFLGPEADRGPFAQLNVGAVIFAYKSAVVSIPAGAGSISAGIAVGWRFPFGKHWYIEPAVRAGYPYVVGAGVSAGFRL